jgi:hypothetical protein
VAHQLPCCTFAGAVIYGATPKLITARRGDRRWYGIGASSLYDDKLHDGIKPDFDMALKQLRVWNVFSQLEAQEIVTLPLYATAERCTRASGVRLVTDAGMRLVASIEVDISPLIEQGVPLGERGVRVQLQFGKTELQMRATVLRTGQALSVKVQYT